MGPNALPDRVSPTNFGSEVQEAAIGERPSTKALGLFTTNFGGSQQQPLEKTPFHEVRWAETFWQRPFFNTLQSFIQCPDRIFEVLLPQSANRALFLPRMLSSRSGSLYSSPASLAAFIFQRAFAFWASCGFLTPTALLISL